MSATSNGKIDWNLGGLKPKPNLTPEMLDAKAKDIASRYGNLFMAFGLAVTELAESGDVLGLQALAAGAKMLLADGVARCADAIDATEIME